MSNNRNSLDKRINSEAKKLSKTYMLDEKRVVKVLHKLAEVNWYDPDYAVYSELVKAFQYLSPNDALEYFEKKDLIRLATRVLLVDYLNAPTTPFYTIDTLSDLTKEFIDHLNENKDHLIKTGFPESSFEKSLWLDKHLNKLYYVEIPYEKLSVHLKTRLQEVGFDINKNKDDPFIQGFAKEDVHKIECMRGKLFNLTVNILERLFDAAKTRNNHHLISDCVDIIYRYLDVKEINYLIKKDYFFTNVVYNKSFSNTNKSKVINHSAGLSDLFMVIGHFYKEIELCTMDEICKKLNNMSNLSFPNSYFIAIGEIWQKDLDYLLYYYAVLEERELELWNEYELRINEMIYHKALFTQEYRTLEKDEKIGLIEQHMNVNVADTNEVTIDRETFKDLFRQLLESGGEVVLKFPPSKNLNEQKPEYIFVNMGKVWRIAYKGDEIFLNDIKGLHYIKVLLSKQFEELNTGYLVSIVQKSLPNKTHYSNMSNEQLGSEGLNKSYGKGEKIASKTTEQIILKQIKELMERRDKAIDNEHFDLADKYYDELEELTKTASREYGKKFNKIATSKDYKNKYDVVYANINRAINEIKKLNPDLGNHLEQSIQTGKNTSYFPPDKVPWILENKLLK